MKLKIRKILNKAGDFLDNLVSNGKFKLSYIAEGRTWVINDIGQDILSALREQGIVKTRITTTPKGIRNQIIHFGSVSTFLRENGFRHFHKSNKAVLSWFHFVKESASNRHIIEAQKKLCFVHTACALTEKHLVGLGVDAEKIVIIPLGIDLSLFKPAPDREKQQLKKVLQLPENKIVIGSFQKDGVGWGKGREPKLIKGPDVFVEAVAKLAEDYPVFVLLAGPSRGYVKFNLEKRNVPFKHIGFLEDSKEVAQYYNVLDLYLITSRIEGGPKAVLEALASGVPLVSTKVGMVPDITQDRKEILLAEIENVNQVVEKAKEIIENGGLREMLIKNGLQRVKDYSWEKIAQRYYQEIYSKMGL